MAIQAAQLFSPDPGHIADFTKMSVGDIFANITNSLGRFDPPPEEEAEEDPNAGELPERQRYTPNDLFSAPSRSQSIIPSEQSPQIKAPSPTSPVSETPSYDYSAPVNESFGDPADFIFESEARRGKDGKLQVYQPPSGDGGGSFEVAGITARYQPKEAAQLREMIQSGRADEAEKVAKQFFRARAAPFTSKTANKGLQLQLADTVHHRGEGGLRRVLQRATGSESKDYGELIGNLSDQPDAMDRFNDARRNYEWEEVDRGRESRKKFRKGLQNRFNKADTAARSLLQS